MRSFISICLGFVVSFVSIQANANEYHPKADQFTLSTYQDNFVLPIYFTNKPNQAYFAPQNPNNTDISNYNIQFQFSLKYGLWNNLFTNNDALYFSYTQLSNWQAYDKSAYFRDTQYQPEIFWVLLNDQKASTHWQWQNTKIGLEHQSNGKGGIYERSWNRAYINVAFSHNNFSINIKPWIRVHLFNSEDYNSDINKYMGNGEVSLDWAWQQMHIKASFRNQIESNFSKGYQDLNLTFPIYKKLKGYVRLQSGYGLTISNYNHYDNAAGIGLAL